jgi:hypothetical protein
VSVIESHYAVLQIDPEAEPEIIEAAYRRLSRKYHPDVSAAPDAVDRMRAINAAYATLSNSGRRVIYDRQLRHAGIRQRLAALRTGVDTRLAPETAVDLADVPAQVERYRAVSEPLGQRAAGVMGRWAAEWAAALDQVISGDPRGKRRVAEAGQRCVDELADCLHEWERLSAPPVARRLNELAAACLKLELALVRGTLSFADNSDFSVLQPLAGLADRIGALTRTIAAETVYLSRQAA